MAEKLQKPELMLCPCCGVPREIERKECVCGARQVGAPLAQPEVILPKLGQAFLAFGLPVAIILGFLAFWLFGSDMKVARALLVLALGESTEFTSNLLKNDPRLPAYRIFSFNGYRLAALCSIGVAPFSLLCLWLARRAVRLAQEAPKQFGGLRLARASFALALVVFISFSAVGLSSVPGAVERGRAKRIAANNAIMYEHVNQALQAYYYEFGTYPQDLVDLSRVYAGTPPQQDYWGQQFSYSPVGVVASKGNVVSFSNYKLVSAGPDGEFGTADDITMVDGVIIDQPSASDLPASLQAPEKPRKYNAQEK